MIRTTVKLFSLCLAIGVITTSCSNDDSSPVKPPIVDPEKPEPEKPEPATAITFDFSAQNVVKQLSFKDNATTDLGTTVSKEWEPTLAYLKPIQLTLDKEKLVVTYNESKVKEYTVKIENNNIVIQATKDYPSYTFAKISEDKKSLSIYSSFFRIKGAHKTLNVNNVASLQEYGEVDFTTFANKYNHLKNTSGKYLKVEFKYTQKN
ncbi:hypothetical protein HMPREF9713_00592 [Myroides odoratimimus CCUG 12700]|uniref:hypothetical protein n=1 Tax=Myroides odoratimimus TaxID=76832 RepID=UPI0003545EE5|nr:hypothetical protein [Myroides odoratimimus]EPH13517.1 hypothetical protein HMPREF9713_00592 [Myroides odoratimimus CCUG 12700]